MQRPIGRNRNLTLMIAAALVALFSGTPNEAAADDHGYSFNCDVPAGRLSTWTGPIYATKPFEVVGSLTIPTTRYDRRWWPVGSLFLEADDDRQVGIQFAVNPDEAEDLQIMLTFGERQTLATVPFPEFEQSISFKLSLSSSGELTAEAGGNSVVLELGDFDANRMSMSCSSGEFTFDDVTIETPASSTDSA